jgi:hypothetical protein
LVKNGHNFNARQSELEWKQLVQCYFAGEVKFEYAKDVREILGARTQAASYSRALSSRLRARPKRKFPRDIGEAEPEDDHKDDNYHEDEDEDDAVGDDAVPHTNVSPTNVPPSNVPATNSHSLRSKGKKKLSGVKFASPTPSPAKKKTKIDGLKSFLKDFVERQIETEERTFEKFKAVHDSKVNTLKDLLSTLEAD